MKALRIVTITAVLTLLLALVCVPMTSASNDSHRAWLLGFEEVPAVSSTGTGELRLKIDEDSQTIEYELSYENLEGTITTASHIHLGQTSVNGGVFAFLCGGDGKPACTPTSGTFTGTIGVANILGPAVPPGQGLAAGEFAEAVRAIRAGSTYVNVHTNKHPGGEIRGQIK